MGTTRALTAVAVVAGLAGTATHFRLPRRWWFARAAAVGLALAATIVGIATAALVGTEEIARFGVLHLAYLGLVLAIPLLGLGVLVRIGLDRELARRAALPTAAVLLLPAVIGWYATHVEPYRLRIDRVQVPVAAERAGNSPVRIGVLADLQTADVGDHERRAVEKLLAERPDLILVAGDLFQGAEASFAAHEDELRELLGRLQAPHGVYVVRGDVDPGDRADRALRGTSAVILDDRIVEVRVRDRLLRIGGHRLNPSSAGAEAVRRDLERGSEDGAVRILLAHRPDTVLALPDGSRVDLTVAGHTHGGQVVLPGFGPLVTLSEVPRAVARGGLHLLRGNRIYVSTGVGLERGQAPQVRLFARPSIGVLDLTG